jgi:two-component system, OmpR family, response regulator
MPKILIVEDEAEVLEIMKNWLESQQFLVDLAVNGEEAMGLLATFEYDAILLDWTLPDMEGLEILREIRGRGCSAPVIMVTGNRTLDHKEAGLDSGADDYLTKPVQLRELTARIRAVMRRTAGATTNVLKFGDLTLDPAQHVVEKSGKEIDLMPKEFMLLEFFIRHPDTVFTSESLIERVWPTDSEVSSELIRKYVSRIRSRIDTAGDQSYIKTVHGVGYRFVLPKTAS